MTTPLPRSLTVFLLVLSSAAPATVRGQRAGSTEVAQSDAYDQPTDVEASADHLPAAVREIRDALGGPTVDRFPNLRRDDERPAAPTAPDHRPRGETESVRVLRESAARLDQAANRLESLELYAQADALRQQAQRLRLDARRLSGSTSSADPTPAAWIVPTPPTPAATPDGEYSMPRLRTIPPQRAPELRRAPRRSDPAEPLVPVPRPEQEEDAPQPQPLLDSPVAPLEPDVEVEG
jgi:hypothetical protein